MNVFENERGNFLAGTLKYLSSLTQLITLDVVYFSFIYHKYGLIESENVISGSLRHLSLLTNLRKVSVGRNKMHGSLEPLQACKELIELSIVNLFLL